MFIDYFFKVVNQLINIYILTHLRACIVKIGSAPRISRIPQSDIRDCFFWTKAEVKTIKQ